MKYIFLLAAIILLSCEKQVTPISNEVDTLNFKNAEQEGEFLNIEIDSSFTDTVIIIITDN